MVARPLTGRGKLSHRGVARPSLHIDSDVVWLRGGESSPEPHPELGPAVRELHLWLVESSAYFHGTDADAISAAVCLPAGIVRAALLTLGLVGRPARPAGLPLPPGERIRRITAFLATHGRATTPEIARGCGLPGWNTGTTLAGRPDLFAVAERRRRRGKPTNVWTLVPSTN